MGTGYLSLYLSFVALKICPHLYGIILIGGDDTYKVLKVGAKGEEFK